ncbi:MAG TPA: ribonuclease E activity regulator RraA [Burkholderiaceae bacterium]|jgi:regulator of ribonuclease activity A|nr:ribonuclease E activity regulator RraA [Burkholderiaceae bacterium]
MSQVVLATTDLCDAHEDRLHNGSLRVLPPLFKSFGKRMNFHGPAYTLEVWEDNSLVRATLETPGSGQVLVVDGGASLRCALVGGQLGLLAEKNAWTGIIVNGCIRDSQEINACDIGVRALALHPQRSAKKGAGERNVSVTIADVNIASGNWIYADADGVLVSDTALT